MLLYGCQRSAFKAPHNPNRSARAERKERPRASRKNSELKPLIRSIVSLVVVMCRCSFLPSRCEAIRSHERGVHLHDDATHVPEHTAVQNLATGEDSERCSERGGGPMVTRILCRHGDNCRHADIGLPFAKEKTAGMHSQRRGASRWCSPRQGLDRLTTTKFR